MNKHACVRAGVMLAAITAMSACGGGESNDQSSAVVSDTGVNLSPAPAPSPTPAPGAGPGVGPVVGPAPAPVGSGLQNGYPTANLSCAVGTPMRFARATAVNYNGGVFRLTPDGGSEETIVWQTAHVTSQRHGSSTTYSGPTEDMRGAWLTVSDAGEILGGGIHTGMTNREVIRCGVAKDGVDVIGEQHVTMQCRTGVIVQDDGTIGLPGTPQYTDRDPVTVVYDFTDFPYTSLSAPPYLKASFPFGTPSSNLILDATFNGATAQNFFVGQSTGFSFIVQDGQPVAFRESRPSPAVVINLECQQSF